MILLLSGASGSGKTSACRIVAEAAASGSIPTGGVVCDALFENGCKTGIRCTDLSPEADGRTWQLARVRPGALPRKPEEAARTAASPSAPAFDDSDEAVVRYGMWEFRKPALAAADAAIAEYVAALGDAAAGHALPMVFVDEVGPLELDHGTGLMETLAALDAAVLRGSPGALYLIVARPDIAARLAARWPAARTLSMEGITPRDAAECIIAAHGTGRGSGHSAV